MSVDDNIDLVPTPPNPTYVSIISALIRGVLQIAAGVGFGWGAFVSGEQITMISAALVMIATLAWSAYQKIQAVRKREHAAIASAVQSAKVSAAAGEPVPVVITHPTADEVKA